MRGVRDEDFTGMSFYPYDGLAFPLGKAPSEGPRGRGIDMEYVFGDHRLDVDRRELRRGGEPVALEPQVFDLLVHLVRNPDRVVSKNELLEAVWGGRIVSESALTTRVGAAREAGGGSG